MTGSSVKRLRNVGSASELPATRSEASNTPNQARMMTASSASRPRVGVIESVDPAIPVVRSAALVHVELAAHAADLPFQVAVLQLRDGAEPGQPPRLQVDIPDDEAAEVREVRKVSATTAD